MPYISFGYLQVHTVAVVVAALLLGVLPQISIAFERPGSSSSDPYMARCYAFYAVALEPTGKIACEVTGFGDACVKIGDRINNVPGNSACGNTPAYASFGKDLIIYNQWLDIGTVAILGAEGVALVFVAILVLTTRGIFPHRTGFLSTFIQPTASALIGIIKLLHFIAGIFSLVIINALYNALDQLRYDGNSNAGQTVWSGGGFKVIAILPFVSLFIDTTISEYKRKS